MLQLHASDGPANVFDDLGGGILMSATLEPLDVFTACRGWTRWPRRLDGPRRAIRRRTAGPVDDLRPAVPA